MNGIIKQIEKGKPFFEKISRNIYLGAIRDGFLAAMPAILFSSIFILLAAIPEIFGFKLPNDVSTCLLYTSPSPRDISGSRMPSSA